MGNNTPSNPDLDLFYAKSSSEAEAASTEHERANIDHGKETSSGDPRSTDFANRVQSLIRHFSDSKRTTG